MHTIRRSDLAGPAGEVAPWLLNKLLVSWIDDECVVGRIVEVEAYDEADPASHTFRGRTTRNEAMFGAAGHLYVYLIYGIHHCANVVVGPVGSGEAVLVRAVTIESGIETARMRRTGRPNRELANGPGKLCQALSIDGRHNAVDLLDPAGSVVLTDDGTPVPSEPIVGPRIGITKGVDTPWRFRCPPGS